MQSDWFKENGWVVIVILGLMLNQICLGSWKRDCEGNGEVIWRISVGLDVEWRVTDWESCSFWMVGQFLIQKSFLIFFILNCHPIAQKMLFRLITLILWGRNIRAFERHIPFWSRITSIRVFWIGGGRGQSVNGLKHIIPSTSFWHQFLLHFNFGAALFLLIFSFQLLFGSLIGLQRLALSLLKDLLRIGVQNEGNLLKEASIECTTVSYPFDSTHHSLNGKTANQATENNQKVEYDMNPIKLHLKNSSTISCSLKQRSEGNNCSNWACLSTAASTSLEVADSTNLTVLSVFIFVLPFPLCCIFPSPDDFILSLDAIWLADEPGEVSQQWTKVRSVSNSMSISGLFAFAAVVDALFSPE